MTNKRILFLSHEAKLSGAPLVLLNLLKWIKSKHPKYNFSVLLLKGGPYLADFQETTSSVYILSDYAPIFPPLHIRAWNKFTSRKNYISPEENLIKDLLKFDVSIIYCNTVLTLDIGLKIKNALLAQGKTAKLICHVHELNMAIQILYPQINVPSIDTYIAVSESVKENLIRKQIDPTRIEVVNEFVESFSIEKSKMINKIHFNVGACGLVELRKGFDIFIQVAYILVKKFNIEDIRFNWIGYMDDFHKILINEDIRKLGITEYINFSGESNEVKRLMNEFDIFLMTSREDPMPLVCIEAGQLGIPIICFSQAGGTEELLASGGGVLIPYLDVYDMAKAVLHYYQDKVKLQKDGETILLSSQNFTTSVQAPKIIKLLESLY